MSSRSALRITPAHIDATPASYVWTVAAPADNTAPQTTIDDGPPAETPLNSATLTFSASEIGATFECSLDGAAFSTCVSPLQLTNLSVGVHQLRVRAIDASFNRDITPASRNWLRTPPPETTILTGPALETESTSATLHVPGRPARRELRVRPRPGHFLRELCISGVGYANLAFGPHEFFVRARGPMGNVETTPAAYEWEIGDLTPPVVTITDGPPIATTDTTPTFEFEADDPETVFQCSIDGAIFIVCESPKTYTEAEIFAASEQIAGTHTFSVHGLKQHLLADPVPAEWEWTIDDFTAPETTILSGPPAEIAIDALIPSTFVFSSNEPDAEFECAIDPGLALPVWSQCASPPENVAEFSSLLPGVHTLLVRAVDPSLNADPTPESYTWTVVGPPITTISSGPAEGSITNAVTATFEFAADQTGVTYMCALDDAELAPCTSPVSFTAADLAGPEIDATPYGEHTFQVQATNRYLHVEDPPASRTWIVNDGVAPQTTIDAGPSGTTYNPTVTLTFSSNELDADFQCSLNGELFTGCSSPHEISDLPLGDYTFQVFATDIALNVDTTPASRTWTVAVPPPSNTPAGTDITVQFTSPVAASVTFAGSLSAGLHIDHRGRHRARTAARLRVRRGPLLRRRHNGRVLGAGDGVSAVQRGGLHAAGPRASPRRHRVGRRHSTGAYRHRHGLRRRGGPLAVRRRRR